MAVSYKKLFIDRDMKKEGLCVAAGISYASVLKLGKMKMLLQIYWKKFVLF